MCVFLLTLITHYASDAILNETRTQALLCSYGSVVKWVESNPSTSEFIMCVHITHIAIICSSD